MEKPNVDSYKISSPTGPQGINGGELKRYIDDTNKYMEYISKEHEFVAIKERSGGNETVGDMWLESKVFTGEATLAEVHKWAENKGNGKLIITKQDNTNKF